MADGHREGGGTPGETVSLEQSAVGTETDDHEVRDNSGRSHARKAPLERPSHREGERTAERGESRAGMALRTHAHGADHTEAAEPEEGQGTHPWRPHAKRDVHLDAGEPPVSGVAIAYPYGVLVSDPGFLETTLMSSKNAGEPSPCLPARGLDSEGMAEREKSGSVCAHTETFAAAGREGKASEGERREDGCVFRYSIPALPASESPPSARLAEMLRQQLRNILDIAVPQKGGQDVEVDSFRLLSESRTHFLYAEKRHAVNCANTTGLEDAAVEDIRIPWPEVAFNEDENGGESRHGQERGKGAHLPAGKGSGADNGFQNLESAALYEPRVEFIARQLASLLAVVELESGGRPVEVDAFRLRDLDDWTGPHAPTPADLFLHAATRCQLGCVFCYNRGAPPTLKARSASVDAEWRELSARLARYRPRAGTGLFPTFGGPRELFAHPQALRLLRETRALTDAPFRLSTNGAALDRVRIAALAELAPLFLDLSLNSASPRRRAMLMGDPEPEMAIRALPLLSEAGIPFAATIVAWPLPDLEEMLEDLCHTAHYAAAAGARMVQINLPGFSRFFSPRAPFDTATVWPEIVRAAQELRWEMGCPVFVSPAMYEENLTRPVKNRAEVIGVVPGSPAARAGLEAGDLITAVNGVRVNSRPQARDLLSRLQDNDAGGFVLRVDRGGKEVDLCGDTGRYSYPYDPQTGTHLGAVFMGSGFRAGHLDTVQSTIRARGAQRPLLLTSALVRPTLEQLLRERPLSLPDGCSLSLDVPENRYFGGNIILGDLLVVEDFIACIEEFSARSGRPDLALIPSSPFRLSGWGRDLTGRPYLEIERRTGVAVELLPCETIWE